MTWGLPDGTYEHRHGMITKAEVRAIALGKLRLPTVGVLWDIGAGSGRWPPSAPGWCPVLRVFAIERRADDADPPPVQLGFHRGDGHTRRGPGGVGRLARSRPGVRRRWRPTAVEAALSRLRPEGTIVATYAALDRASGAAALLGHIVQVSVSRGVPVGKEGALPAAGGEPGFRLLGTGRMSRTLSCSVTAAGAQVARRLPYEHHHGQLVETVRSQWAEADAFVLVGAVGIAVRAVAPLLSDKGADPAVVCVDDAGRFAVRLVGGHAGGGNALAREVAAILGADPVITTARMGWDCRGWTPCPAPRQRRRGRSDPTVAGRDPSTRSCRRRAPGLATSGWTGRQPGPDPGLGATSGSWTSRHSHRPEPSRGAPRGPAPAGVDRRRRRRGHQGGYGGLVG